MMHKDSSKPTVQIAWTPEHQAQSQQATGKEANRLKLEALEARVAPVKYCL
jgi:hypothetical protein